MKQFWFLMLFSVALATSGQTLEIKGRQFQLYINDNDMTAAIRDNVYRVDDTKLPIYVSYRKFKNMGGERVHTVVIPATYKAADGREYKITTIGRAAFAGYDNVDNVVIPSTVTTIEDFAFFRSSVVTVEIPPSVSQIGNRVFGHCKKLRNLTLPLGVEVSPDLYSESKNISVKYQLDEAVAATVAQRRTVKGEDGYALTSDVDEDIPLLSTKNR